MKRATTKKLTARLVELIEQVYPNGRNAKMNRDEREIRAIRKVLEKRNAI